MALRVVWTLRKNIRDRSRGRSGSVDIGEDSERMEHRQVRHRALKAGGATRNTLPQRMCDGPDGREQEHENR